MTLLLQRPLPGGHARRQHPEGSARDVATPEERGRRVLSPPRGLAASKVLCGDWRVGLAGRPAS